MTAHSSHGCWDFTWLFLYRNSCFSLFFKSKYASIYGSYIFIYFLIHSFEMIQLCRNKILLHIVRNSIWMNKNRASANEGKFHSFLMCRIWIYGQKLKYRVYFSSERQHYVTFHPHGIFRCHWLSMFTFLFTWKVLRGLNNNNNILYVCHYNPLWIINCKFDGPGKFFAIQTAKDLMKTKNMKY